MGGDNGRGCYYRPALLSSTLTQAGMRCMRISVLKKRSRRLWAARAEHLHNPLICIGELHG